MATPSWSLLRLRLPQDDTQDIIFVYHGNARDDLRIRPTNLPVSLHLGGGDRSWRGGIGPESESWEVVGRAVRARQGGKRNFLRIPYFTDDLLDFTGWRLDFVALVVISHVFLFGLVLTGCLVCIIYFRTGSVIFPEIGSGHFPAGSGPALTPISSSPPSPETYVKVIPFARTLRDLLSEHHTRLQDSWTMLRDFESDAGPAIDRLNLLLTPSSLTRPSNMLARDEHNIANIANRTNTLRSGIKRHANSHIPWNDEAMSKWLNLAAWWAWEDADFTPWRHLSTSIPANSTPKALETFKSTILPQNVRIYGLVDRIVCSGHHDLHPWHGIRAHYAQADEALSSLNQDLANILSLLEPKGTWRLRSKDEVDHVLVEVLAATRRANRAVGVGLNAARNLAADIGSMCTTIMRTAEIEWRIPAQSNSSLSAAYLSNSTAWYSGKGRQRYNEHNPKVNLWLSWPPTADVVADITAITKVIWLSQPGKESQ